MAVTTEQDNDISNIEPSVVFNKVRSDSNDDEAAIQFQDINIGEQTDLLYSPVSEHSSIVETGENVKRQRATIYVYLVVAFSGMGGFLFGYDAGVVSGVLILLKCQFHLTTFQKELFVSIAIFFAAISSLLSAMINDVFGRRFVLLASSVMVMLGAFLLAFAANLPMLFSGRAFIGIGMGFSFMTCPIYIAETVPVQMRGRFAAVNQRVTTFGLFTASLVNGLFIFKESNGWRYMLGLTALPAVLQLIGFFFLPESPRWLVARGRVKVAEDVLKMFRGTDDVSQEICDIKFSCQQFESRINNRGNVSPFIQIFKVRHVAKAVSIGCLLHVFQQLSGITSVMYYSTSIIKMAGVGNNAVAIWLSVMVSGVNFTCNMLGMWLVEKIGRRPLLLISSFATTISLAFLALSFQLSETRSPEVTVVEASDSGQYLYNCSKYSNCDTCLTSGHCGYCFEGVNYKPVNGSCVLKDSHLAAFGRCASDPSLEDACSQELPVGSSIWTTKYCPSSLSWMATIGLVFYLASFAPGMGPLPWTLNSEIYPLWARATGYSLSTTTNWTCNLLVSITFLTFTDVLHKYGTFWLYSMFSLIGFIFFLFMVPETKGIKLEDLEAIFKQPWWAASRGPGEGNLYTTVTPVPTLARSLSDSSA